MTVNEGVLQLNGPIQLRGGTYEALRTQNPLLSRREIITEVDTGRLKIGDGVRRWNELAYTSDVGNMSVPTLTLNFEADTEILRGSEREIIITTNSDGEIEIVSSDDSVAEITTETNIDEQYFIHAVASGEAVITVRVKASENYFAVEKSFNVTVNNVVRYGYRINKNESDPYARVEYLYDAVGKMPAHMDFANEVFDYGDWGSAWFVTDNKPCMLRSNGTVDYYLNPNDYTLKEDGTASDVANVNYDGNAMAQIPLVWVYRYEDENYCYEIISNIQYDENYKAYAHTRADGSIADYFYWSMFGGSGGASKIRSLSGQTLSANLTTQQEVDGCLANGSNWYTHTWSQHELIRTLLVLMGKSTNTQAVYGNGYVVTDAYETLPLTGLLKDKGQFFGYSSTKQQMKVFHIEEFWGSQSKRTAGIISNGNSSYEDVYVKMTPEGSGYRITDTNGYTYTGIRVYGMSEGYINAVICNEYGMIPKTANGSGTTYYCDCFYYTINYNYNAGIHYLILGTTMSVSVNDNGAFMTRIDLYPTKYASLIGCGLSCLPSLEE